MEIEPIAVWNFHFALGTYHQFVFSKNSRVELYSEIEWMLEALQLFSLDDSMHMDIYGARILATVCVLKLNVVQHFNATI